MYVIQSFGQTFEPKANRPIQKAWIRRKLPLPGSNRRCKLPVAWSTSWTWSYWATWWCAWSKNDNFQPFVPSQKPWRYTAVASIATVYHLGSLHPLGEFDLIVSTWSAQWPWWSSSHSYNMITWLTCYNWTRCCLTWHILMGPQQLHTTAISRFLIHDLTHFFRFSTKQLRKFRELKPKACCAFTTWRIARCSWKNSLHISGILAMSPDMFWLKKRKCWNKDIQDMFDQHID